MSDQEVIDATRLLTCERCKETFYAHDPLAWTCARSGSVNKHAVCRTCVRAVLDAQEAAGG